MKTDLELYEQTTLECSRLITRRYSTSFTLGIRTLDRRFHWAIYAIYGFVRYADEIVDTFHGYDKKTLFTRFRADTYQALREGISLNPVLHAYQKTVHTYGISDELTEAFFRSMEMDLDQTHYSEEGYETYIYGSAEVVGLMCLCVFCEGDRAMYDRLSAPARRLGAAFQKVNFLRDVRSDFLDRGRTYFPGVDFNRFSGEDKRRIEADIQSDFDAALAGIRQLPRGARAGVYLAYCYYLRLFARIRSLPVSRIREERVRVPDIQKLFLFARTWLRPI